MNLLQSILMGLIQGLTEFLPVSSSGHLAIFQYIFKMNTDTGLLFEVMLHLGTLIAVCVIFFKDIKNLVINGVKLLIDVCSNIKTFFTNKSKKTNKKYRRLIDNAYKKFVVLIIVTTIPTGIIGILFNTFIAKASASLLVPGICLVVTAILLLLADGKEGGKKKVKATSYKDAGLIGIVQGIATLPGLSRSGTTITACLFLGFDRNFAVKYSFIASIPAILGANLLELRHVGEVASSGGNILYYFVGMVVAGLVGYICIKAMMYIVKKSKFEYFAYYCAVIGVISIICYFIL